MKRINKEYLKVCDNLEWQVNVNGDYVELEKYSPAGEDFNFSVTLKNFKDDVLEYSFDEDEHVRMWLNAKDSGVSGVPSAKELVNDAEEITSMINELKEELSKLCSEK